MKGIRCQLTRLSIGLLAAMFAVIILLSRTVFLDGYELVEEHLMAGDLSRATDAITYRLRELDRTALDWSAWDDTCRFIADQNQAYIASNLPDKSVAGIDVNLMRFLNTADKPVYSKWVTIKTQQASSAPAGLSEALLPVSALLKTRPVSDGVRGIVMLPQGPLLVASRHIIASSFSGPSQGSFLVGRLLDASLLDLIRNQTRLDLTLLTGTSGLTPQKPIQITRLDEQTIQGRQLISDILGTPVLTLQVTAKRSVYQLGRSSSLHVTSALLLSGAGIALILFIYGERGIVRHLIRMSRQADAIARSGNDTDRLEVGGAPELQSLGNSVNNMLASLEQAHRTIQQSELKHRVVLQQSKDAIILFDPATSRILDANQAFHAITGFPADELQQLRPERLLVASAKLPAVLRLLKRTGQLALEGVLCRTSADTVLEMDISVSLVRLDGHILLSAILHDVTRRNHEQRIIHEMAITDALTGIANRRHLFDRAEQELERLKRSRNFQNDTATVGCILLDIDYFKSINDTWGHQCGDEVLKELARRLETCVRPYDLIGRYGGEEFAVFVVNASSEQTHVVAERIWQSIRSAHFYYGSTSFPVTASLGISCVVSDTDTLDSIIHRADAALYQAKQSGRDRIVTVDRRS